MVTHIEKALHYARQVRAGEVIAVCEKSKKLVKGILENSPAAAHPNWMDVSIENLTASLVNAPSREDLDQSIKEALIVEYYSR